MLFWEDEDALGLNTIGDAGSAYIFSGFSLPTYSISGNVFDDSVSQLMVNGAWVYLIKEDSTISVLPIIDSTIVDGSGMYTFNNVSIGNYLLLVYPDTAAYSNTPPTYHFSELFWHKANAVQVISKNLM